MFDRFIRFGITIFFISLITSPALATESRIKSLGEQDLYLVDDTDIFSNPALCSRYPGMFRLHAGGLDAEDGDSDLYAYGGFNVTPISGLTLGAYFGRHPEYEEGGIKRITDWVINDSGQFVDEFGYFIEGDLPTNDAVEWHNPADLLISYSTGNTAFGLGYYTANGKYREENDSPADAKYGATDYEIESSLHSIKAGSTFTIGRWTTELWGKYIPYEIDSDWEATGVLSVDEEKSRMRLEGDQWGMGARVLYRIGEGLYIIPALRWEKSRGEVSYDTAPDIGLPSGTSEEGLDRDYAVSEFETGVGLRYGSGRIFLLGGASVKWTNERYEFTESYGYFFKSKETDYLAMPAIGLGMEYRVLDRLSLRWGINSTTFWAENIVYEKLKDSNRPKQDWKNSTREESIQNTTASLGLGLNFGNLHIDAVVGDFVLAGEPGPAVAGGSPFVFSGMDLKYIF